MYEGLRERTAESAEEKYLKIVTDLPNYGVTFFRAIVSFTSDLGMILKVINFL
jgi:hypothetical protein